MLHLILLRPFKSPKRSFGGAAIEYIIVSAFAMMLALGAIAFITATIKQKLAAVETKLGIEFDTSSLLLGD